MTDSKFCEHGVNVGLENPPVFCGQCPPDTITKLRADLASVRLDYANECDRARRAEARHERDKDELRADLARVTKERDEARAKVATVGWRWSHDIPSVTCPKCGGTTSNPFEDHEHITDESEEVAVCEECEHEFWVTAFYRAQFRFDVQEYEPDAEALGVRS